MFYTLLIPIAHKFPFENFKYENRSLTRHVDLFTFALSVAPPLFLSVAACCWIYGVSTFISVHKDSTSTVMAEQTLTVEETTCGIIQEGDQVVIRKDKNLKVVPVRRNRCVLSDN